MKRVKLDKQVSSEGMDLQRAVGGITSLCAKQTPISDVRDCLGCELVKGITVTLFYMLGERYNLYMLKCKHVYQQNVIFQNSFHQKMQTLLNI